MQVDATGAVAPQLLAESTNLHSSSSPADGAVDVCSAVQQSDDDARTRSIRDHGYSCHADHAASAATPRVPPLTLEGASVSGGSAVPQTGVPIVVNDHPLSPDVALATSSRSSYFRPPILPGTSAVSNVIFRDDDEDEPEHMNSSDHAIDRRQSTPKPSSSSVSLKDAPESDAAASEPVLLRLSQPPHLITPHALNQRLLDTTAGALGGARLAQELSRQVAHAKKVLHELESLKIAREAHLTALLRETAGISENIITRALVRADAEAKERWSDTGNDTSTWKIFLPGHDQAARHVTIKAKKNAGPAQRTIPLDEDLQDAMSENDFIETARSASPGLPPNHNLVSPMMRAHGPSVASSSHIAAQERRARHSSQSLSSRLFGFTPPTTSYLSPTSEGFSGTGVSPTASLHGERPIQSKTKKCAKSIKSVASTSSQSNRGLSGWTAGLWGWRKGSPRHYLSDEDESGDEDAPENSQTPVPSSTFSGATGPSQSDRPSTATSRSGRVRTFSRSSTNSASAKSYDTTAATSISSPLLDTSHTSTKLHHSEDSPESGANSPIRSLGITLPAADSTSPVHRRASMPPPSALLARRPSAAHSNAAVSTDAATISAATSSSLSTDKQERWPAASASSTLLQAIHNQQTAKDDRPYNPPETPRHFRAISDSASTLGRNSGKFAAAEIFAKPERVSQNVAKWTERLLSAFTAPPMPSSSLLSATPTTASEAMMRSNSGSTSTSRSRSQRLPQTLVKAAPSPAIVVAGGANTARLAVSPSASSAHTTSCHTSASSEAIGLASSTVPKEKGYIASAKGTIGRAFGLGSPSASTPTKASRSNGSSAKPLHKVKPRSPSRNLSIEPALTVPATFASFVPSQTAFAVGQSTVSPRKETRAPAVSSPLEMGTIVPPENKPPTLSKDLSDQMKDGPLVDRFGFVYDLRIGMKPLKEHRLRQEKDANHVIHLTASESVTSNAEAVPTVNEEDLREAIGPSPSVTPGVHTAFLEGSQALAEPFGANGNATEVDGASKKDASSQLDKGASNQSIKRLLTQLGEMNDSVEKSQKDAWDAFIKRRRDKATRQQGEEATASAKTRRKRATFVEAPLSTNIDSTMDPAASHQFSDALIGVANMGSGKQDDKTFRQLVRSGIPIAYRPSIWAEVSGASEIREPGLYRELLSKHEGENSPCLEQIDMDTHRTFPTNVFFAGNGPGVAKLRRVLIAYSWRDPSIGYCQGMNLLAALLLLVYPDEEDAFWMLASVLERTLPSDYYSSQLLVSQADQRVLQDLIELALPDLFYHLQDLGVDLPAITFGWFLSLFTDALPIQTLLRVWDVLLVYGPISLFKIAIAIFKIQAPEIFATDSASSFYVLMTSGASHMYNAERLLQIAFEELRFIKRHDIETRRVQHVADIERELQPRRSPTPPPTSNKDDASTASLAEPISVTI